MTTPRRDSQHIRQDSNQVPFEHKFGASYYYTNLLGRRHLLGSEAVYNRYL